MAKQMKFDQNHVLMPDPDLDDMQRHAPVTGSQLILDDDTIDNNKVSQTACCMVLQDYFCSRSLKGAILLFPLPRESVAAVRLHDDACLLQPPALAAAALAVRLAGRRGCEGCPGRTGGRRGGAGVR